MMDDNQLIAIATSLENESVDAKTHLSQCNPAQLVCLTANRAGFLRLAAACLRAASAPMIEDDCRSRPVEILLPHDQVVTADSDVVIAFLQRLETWPEPNEYLEARKKRALKNDRWALLTCGLLATAILTVFTAGIMAIVDWIR